MDCDEFCAPMPVVAESIEEAMPGEGVQAGKMSDEDDGDRWVY